MEVKYLGWQSFRFQEGGRAVVTQPFSQSKTGVLFPKIKADLVLQTRKTENSLKKRVTGLKNGRVFWTPGPGEYEVNGIEIRGFASGYWLKMRSFQLAFWWSLEIKDVNKSTNAFPDIDILFLRIGKTSKGFAKKVKEISRKISPTYLIPFCLESMDQKELTKGLWVKPFLDALDQEDVGPIGKLSINQDNIASEELKVVLLKPKI